MELKKCNKCGEHKPIIEFHKDNATKDGLAYECKDCRKIVAKKSRKTNSKRIREYAKKWRQDNVQYRKNYMENWRYGITPEQKKEMLEKHDGKCVISGVKFTDVNVPHVDHNHDSGKVRGLLHRDINLALGLFKDNIEWLKKAIKYLEANK